MSHEILKCLKDIIYAGEKNIERKRALQGHDASMGCERVNAEFSDRDHLSRSITNGECPKSSSDWKILSIQSWHEKWNWIALEDCRVQAPNLKDGLVNLPPMVGLGPIRPIKKRGSHLDAT